MKVFFDPRQAVANNTVFKPASDKANRVMASWRQSGIPFAEVSFAPLTVDEIAQAHDRSYVEGVLNGSRPNGCGDNRADVATALPWICGSMVAAALHAYRTGEVSFSPTSGAHHAGYAKGSSFCTFNFLVIAAIMAHQAGADTVGIIDLDAHYGDGTDQIIGRLGLDYIRHYSFGGDRVDGGDSAEAWLRRLPGIVGGFSDCALLIVNAGVDAHIDDMLGGVLTSEQMARREQIVFAGIRDLGVPVCVSLAGGYQVNFDVVLRLHDHTFKTAGQIPGGD